LQKFKELSFKEKLEHIIYYYKWHIIIAIFLMIFSGSLIKGFIEQDKNIPLGTLSFQGVATDFEKIEAWEDMVTQKIKKADTQQKVRVDFYSISLDGFDEYSTANMQKYVTLAAVGELDVVCVDEDFFISQAELGTFMPLDTLPELSVIIENNKGNIKKLIPKEQTEEHIYGIKVTDLDAFKDLGYNPEGMIMAISASSKRLSYCIEILKFIFE